jgi:flagellar basal body-associated protein FliL
VFRKKREAKWTTKQLKGKPSERKGRKTYGLTPVQRSGQRGCQAKEKNTHSPAKEGCFCIIFPCFYQNQFERHIRMGKTVLKILGVLLLIFCLGLVWYNADSKNIQISSFKYSKKKTYEKTVPVSIISNLGPKHMMKMKIAIPCNDKAQCADLTRNMARMKSAFLTQFDQEEMKNLIDERDFNAIKKAYMGVINSFAKKPVDNIYIDSFNY